MTEKQKASARDTLRPLNTNVIAGRHGERSAQLRMVQGGASDDDITVDFGISKVLLPERRFFEAVFTDWSTAFVFNTGKVFLHFRIVTPGDFFELEVYKPYRAKKVITKGRRGKFVLAAAGDLYSTITKLLDLRVRADRVSFHALRSMIFRIDFRTVDTNYKRQPLPAHLQYSVVNNIMREL